MYRLLIFVSCLAFGYGNSSSSIHPSPVVSSLPSLLTSPVHSTLNSSTVNMTSTLSTANISSTSTPQNATVSPNKTMSSTMMPSSSIAATTPTPKPTTGPTTGPKPTHGDYSVKYKGKYCLLAKLDVSFSITYYQNETKKQGNKTTHHLVEVVAIVDMPFEKDFYTNGSVCDETVPKLVISWPVSRPLYHFEMKFKKTHGNSTSGWEVTESTSGWEVTELSLNVSTENNTSFKNPNETTIQLRTANETELHHLSGNTNGSYKCSIEKTYTFDGKGKMLLKYAKVQPFNVPPNKTEVFGEEKDCQPKPKPKPKKTSSNIVPIAVGCALAGLVLIVLIAYIIGRRKSQRGYEKV